MSSFLPHLSPVLGSKEFSSNREKQKYQTTDVDGKCKIATFAVESKLWSSSRQLHEPYPVHSLSLGSSRSFPSTSPLLMAMLMTLNNIIPFV